MKTNYGVKSNYGIAQELLNAETRFPVLLGEAAKRLMGADRTQRAEQPAPQSAQPVADSDLEKLATNLELYSDYEKGRSQADFLDPVLFGRAAIALYAAGQPVADEFYKSAKYVHDTFKADLDRGVSTRGKRFAVEVLGEALASVQPEVERVPLTIKQMHAMCAKLHDIEDPLDDTDEGWEEVMKLVAAIEAHHGIQPKGEKQ